MNGHFLSRLLSLTLLVLFETNYLYVIAVSGDEMRVPYVPYVVVDKNKDEFNYDRLQDEILGYLNRRHSEASTTLYDFLKTSLSPAATQGTPAADDRTVGRASSPSYMRIHPPQQSSATYPPYPASIYATVRKENPLVTANVKVTTYQPHKYSTPLDNSRPRYTQNDLSSTRNQQVAHQWPTNRWPSAHQLPFIPAVWNNGFTPVMVTTDSALYRTSANDTASVTGFARESGEMKCSLRSNRHVYDGDCVSKKPVMETVCADRCIRYEYKKSKKPYFMENSKINSQSTDFMKKQVVALSCSDGDVTKQKVKLYCKDGTIINNVIRIVQNCVCSEHSEKVHATKRNQKSPLRVKAKRAYTAPKIRPPRPNL